MDKDSLKKNMLLKKEKGDVDVKGNGIPAKESSDRSIQLFRVLAMEDEKVLVIDCIRKTMPVWVAVDKLDGFVEEKSRQSVIKDFDILEGYSPDIKKVIYQRYNIISAILPFVADEAVRSELIARMSEEHRISKQSVRKYLCEYLVSQDIRSLAPQERNTERALSQDEKNMRKALNKYYYTTKKRTLKNVYAMMLKDSYCDGEGKLFSTYPLFYQFRYFFRKYNTRQTEFISRNGKKMTAKVDGQQKQISRLTDKVMEQSNTIVRLQEKASDLGRLERHLGREQVQSIVERSKALEQTERVNKRPKCAFEMNR